MLSNTFLHKINPNSIYDACLRMAGFINVRTVHLGNLSGVIQYKKRKGFFGQQGSFYTCTYIMVITAFMLIGQSSVVATSMTNPSVGLYSVLTNNFPFFRNWKKNPAPNFKEWWVCSNVMNGHISMGRNRSALAFWAFNSAEDAC